MKELDLLKKDWKKSANAFEQISAEEIYKMIHKNSSSTVRWILIISILEFIILNTIGFLLNDEKDSNLTSDQPLIKIVEYASYLTAILFIFLFYNNYRSISALKSSKKLIEVILKTRKIVNYYIICNIVICCIIVILDFFEIMKERAITNPSLTNQVTSSKSFIALGICLALIVGVVLVFYKLVYGKFLKKLHTNYKELKKLDF